MRAYDGLARGVQRREVVLLDGNFLRSVNDIFWCFWGIFVGGSVRCSLMGSWSEERGVWF